MKVLNYLLNILKGIFWLGLFLTPPILCHELAHLLVGWSLGLPAQNFSLGFGPEIFGIDWGGIRWQWRALPFGGYVQFADESWLGVGSGRPGAWVFTALAGPLSGIIYAYLLLGWVLRKIWQQAEVVLLYPRLTDGTPDYDAAPMELLTFKSVNPHWSRQLAEQILLYNPRSHELTTFTMADIWMYFPVEKKSLSAAAVRTRVWRSWCDVFQYAPSVSVPGNILLGKVLNNSASQSSGSGFMGPLGIGQMVYRLVEERSRAKLVIMNAHLSQALSLFNLLPLAALDGGKALWAALTWVLGGLHPALSEWYVIASTGLLLGLLILAFGGDLLKIWRK